MSARARKTNESFENYRMNLKKEANEQKRKLNGKIIHSYPKSNELRLANIEKEGEAWEKKCPKKFIDAAPKTRRLAKKYEKELS